MPADAIATAQNAAIVRSLLKMRATIYGRSAGGTFATVLKSGLACLLTEVEGGRQPGATAAQRRELASIGTFRWDATYALPESGVQIEVDAYPGKRWNPVAATYWPDYAPGLGIVGKTIDVVRANY